LRNSANKQTNADENITFLAEATRMALVRPQTYVKKAHSPQHLVIIYGVRCKCWPLSLSRKG